jgi:hypothetical protein
MAENNSAPKKGSIYLPPDIYEEMSEQAERHGVSVSKVCQDAWRIARCYDGPIPKGVTLFRDGPLDDPPEDEEYEDEDA